MMISVCKSQNIREKTFFLFFICIRSILWAGENAGQTGFDFLRLDLGARPSATGGAFTAQIGDLHSMSYNPASIKSVRDKALTATYVKYIASIQAGYFAYNKALSDKQNLAFSLAYLHYGQMDETDELGNILGTFTPGDILINTVFSNQIYSNTVYGVGLKLIHSQLAEFKSTGIALDLGLNHYIPKQQLHIGFSTRNLGYTLNAYIEDKTKLPLTYRLGISKQLAHLPMIFNCDLIRYHYEKNSSLLGFYLAFGGEFSLSPILLFRWGYNIRGSEQRVGSTSSKLSGLSLGVGIQLSNMTIDISHNYFGALGSVQSFSISSNL